jgi:hypothetical protein
MLDRTQIEHDIDLRQLLTTGSRNRDRQDFPVLRGNFPPEIRNGFRHAGVSFQFPDGRSAKRYGRLARPFSGAPCRIHQRQRSVRCTFRAQLGSAEIKTLFWGCRGDRASACADE